MAMQVTVFGNARFQPSYYTLGQPISGTQTVLGIHMIAPDPEHRVTAILHLPDETIFVVSND